jgi:hypothetical protein
MTTYMQASNGNVIRTSRPEYHPEFKQLKRSEGEALYRAQVLQSALKIISPNATIYCTLRSVSASGMTRRISLHVIHNGELVGLDHTASVLTGRKLSDKGGIVCNGCGMDMGFDLVYSLGYALWPNGTPAPHGMRNGEPDNNGGYALRHSWI